MSHNIKHQPHGFSIFFLTEMWERYGFYIIQGLLVLYLTQYFHFSDVFSYGVLGSFTALAYINPILGGYIADKILGAKKSILWGALLIALGYFLLVMTALARPDNVWVALAFVAMGTGLLKPNISSLLGTLYQEGDTRRYAGFTLFYVGINVGSFLSFLTGGYLQENFSWSLTYFVAGVLLLIAFVFFYWGSRHFKIRDANERVRHSKDYFLALLLIAMLVIFNILILKFQWLSLIVFVMVTLLSIVFVLREAFKSQKNIRDKLIAYLLLLGISVFFWAIYFQLYLSMNLFVDRVVDRDVFGFVIPSSVFIALESVGVIAFGPVLGFLWQYFERKNVSPSTPLKFTLGLFIVAIAFAILFVSSSWTNSQGQVLAVWITLVYFIVALAELLISPTGLAMVTELAPKHLSGLMMGVFFISLGLGGKLAGVIASLAAVPTSSDSLLQMEQIYRHAFGVYALIALSMALVSFLMIRTIKRLTVTDVN